MSNLVSGVSVLGFLPFLFVFWRRLKEDYSSSQIFESGFYIIFGVFFLGLLGLWVLPAFVHSSPIFSTAGLWFWGAFAGFVLGLTISVVKLNLRFFESFEAGSLGMLIWLALIYLTDSLKNSSLPSLIAFGVCLALICLFFFLSGRYKKFTWYRSGKIGFTGLATLGIFFFFRVLVALFFPFVLSFVGRVDALLSGAVSFILFLLLYNLAEI